MEPIRIKQYGLFPITRRKYVVLQSLVFVCLAVALVYTLTLPRSPRFGIDLDNPRLPPGDS